MREGTVPCWIPSEYSVESNRRPACWFSHELCGSIADLLGRSMAKRTCETGVSARRAKPRHDLGEAQEFPEILPAEESADEEEPAGEDDEQHNNGGEEGISIRIGRGDTFAARVYAVLERIPYGKVAAYGQIAGLCAMPRNARQVGHLLADGLAHGTDAPLASSHQFGWKDQSTT